MNNSEEIINVTVLLEKAMVKHAESLFKLLNTFGNCELFYCSRFWNILRLAILFIRSLFGLFSLSPRLFFIPVISISSKLSV